MPVNVPGEEGVPHNNADRGLSAGEQLCRKAPEAVTDSKLSLRKKYLGKKKRTNNLWSALVGTQLVRRGMALSPFAQHLPRVLVISQQERQINRKELKVE